MSSCPQNTSPCARNCLKAKDSKIDVLRKPKLPTSLQYASKNLQLPSCIWGKNQKTLGIPNNALRFPLNAVPRIRLCPQRDLRGQAQNLNPSGAWGCVQALTRTEACLNGSKKSRVQNTVPSRQSQAISKCPKKISLAVVQSFRRAELLLIKTELQKPSISVDVVYPGIES